MMLAGKQNYEKNVGVKAVVMMMAVLWQCSPSVAVSSVAVAALASVAVLCCQYVLGETAVERGK